MHLLYQETDDFIVLNKGYGLRTHRVSDGQFGFVETVAESLKKQLLVVHRLDKETSGLIVFAKSKTAAAQLSELFEAHQIEKNYFFLTDQKIDETKLTIKTHIDKQQNMFVSNKDLPPNSETSFEWIKTVGSNQLWKATPKTGKPHQIRLHALAAGIPILGDQEHSGSRFFRLALHAAELKFNLNGQEHIFKSQLPPCFENSSSNILETILEENFYKRHQLYQISDKESYRLIHLEIPDVRADIFADHLWIYDYSKEGLSASDKESIHQFANRKKLKVVIRHMLNRGQGVGGLESATLETNAASQWPAQENGLNYILKTDAGFSPGLFLDQKENRQWVLKNSSSKKVLNLFSYTSGFSVNAAIGKAQEVTTVDVSQKFLDWSKENFALNNLDSKKFEFFCQDSMVFLKGSVKRERKWDLIICDPPSFARTSKSVWKLESDLPDLAELMYQCLNPNGEILFTCNLEKKSRPEVLQLFTKKLPAKKWTIERLPLFTLDYELTDDLENLMKGFLIKKV